MSLNRKNSLCLSLNTWSNRTLVESIDAGFDHVLMARVNTIPRADGILDLYRELAPELNPLRVDSRMAKRAQRDALRASRCCRGDRSRG